MNTNELAPAETFDPHARQVITRVRPATIIPPEHQDAWIRNGGGNLNITIEHNRSGGAVAAAGLIIILAAVPVNTARGLAAMGATVFQFLQRAVPNEANRMVITIGLALATLAWLATTIAFAPWMWTVILFAAIAAISFLVGVATPTTDPRGPAHQRLL